MSIYVNRQESIILKKLLILSLLVCLAICASAQKTYVLLTGISKYQERKANLNFSTRDVKELDTIFKKQGFVVTKLTSRYVVRDNISEKVDAIVQLSKPEDTIIFFFAGHGKPGGLVMHDLSLLSYHDLMGMLMQAKAQNIVCIIDACHSGSVASDLKGSYEEWGEEAKQRGISFIMGCRADEYSYEDYLTGNGHFTQALKTGLRGRADGWTSKGPDGTKDNGVTLYELYRHIYDHVTRMTKQYGKVQHPQLIAPRSAYNKIITQWNQ